MLAFWKAALDAEFHAESKRFIRQQKNIKPIKKWIFEKLQKLFFFRFALLSVLSPKVIVLELESNSASTDVKIIGDHRTKNVHPPILVDSCEPYTLTRVKYFSPDDSL